VECKLFEKAKCLPDEGCNLIASVNSDMFISRYEFLWSECCAECAGAAVVAQVDSVGNSPTCSRLSEAISGDVD